MRYYSYDSDDCLEGRVKEDKLGGQRVVDQDTACGLCDFVKKRCNLSVVSHCEGGIFSQLISQF